jgi:hypothetical protein
MKSELAEIRQEFDEIYDQILNSGEKAHKSPRVAYSQAVVRFGCAKARDVLHALSHDFGPLMDAIVEALVYDDVHGAMSQDGHSYLSEISKVMISFSQMSRYGQDITKLVRGQDWEANGVHLDIRATTCYRKYRRYCKESGEEMFFDSEQAFNSALKTYHCLETWDVSPSMVKVREKEPIHRLDVQLLLGDQVPLFGD